MKAIKEVFLQYLRQQYRDKYAVFWNLLFPLVLMSILVLVFGGLETGDSLVVKVSLVNFADNNSTDSVALIVEDVFKEIVVDEKQNWLELYQVPEGKEPSQFLQNEKRALEQGQRHAVVLIPADINKQVENIIKAQFIEKEEPLAGKIILYRNLDNQISKLATNIISGIIDNINRELNIGSGLVNSEDLIHLSTQHIETSIEETRSFSMVDYLLPGIILMTFLSSGMEILVEKVSSQRARGILRRYFATPLSASYYFAALFLFIIFISVLQLILIYGWGRFFFDFDINIFTLSSIFFMLYSLLVFLSMGYIVLAFARTTEAAGTMTQGLVYPLIFLGGLFFPVMGLPGFLRIIVLINPVTYLINGLRDTLGVYPSPTSFYLNIGIPALWLIAGIFIASKYFSWNPKGKE